MRAVLLVAWATVVACGTPGASEEPIPVGHDAPLAFVDEELAPSPLAPLTELTARELCGLANRSEIAAATGATLETSPDYLHLEGVGVSCTYFDADTFEVAAKFEIGVLPYSVLQQLWTYDGEELTTEQIPYRRCRIAEREAICAGPYDQAGVPFGATVLVQLGTEDDPALLVEARTESIAHDLALLALANLDV